MLLLFETPAGFSLFKVKDEKKLDDVEVRTIDRSIGCFFRRPAARMNCGFYGIGRVRVRVETGGASRDGRVVVVVCGR